MIAALVVALALQARAKINEPCRRDPATTDGLSFGEFNQTTAAGWRSLDHGGCRRTAIKALRSYREHHAPLTEGERSLLLWHEGQLVAEEGRYAEAIPLLMGGVPKDGGDIHFADYALGTVAFLQRDRGGLLAARTRLAAFPKPTGLDPSFSEFPWPLNLDLIDGLIECFGEPYQAAYSGRPGRDRTYSRGDTAHSSCVDR